MRTSHKVEKRSHYPRRRSPPRPSATMMPNWTTRSSIIFAEETRAMDVPRDPRPPYERHVLARPIAGELAGGFWVPLYGFNRGPQLRHQRRREKKRARRWPAPVGDRPIMRPVTAPSRRSLGGGQSCLRIATRTAEPHRNHLEPGCRRDFEKDAPARSERCGLNAARQARAALPRRGDDRELAARLADQRRHPPG